MHKVLGDICLMAGSPKDAMNNYKCEQLHSVNNCTVCTAVTVMSTASIDISTPEID